VIDLIPSIVGAALLAITGLGTSTALQIRGRVPFALAVLIIASGAIVLVFIALSVVDELRRGYVLLAQFVLAVAAVAGWVAAGSPQPPKGWVPNRKSAVEAVREHRAVTVLLGAAVVALVVDGALGVLAGPSNWDSMTYHLSRAAYWLQNHSATQFEGGTVRQLGSPPNGEMLQAWTMLLSGTDRIASLVQWTALCGLAAAIFSGARMLGFTAGAAAFAAGLFVTMPQPILQASTTQNDLIASFFVAAAALFGVRGVRDGALGDIVVAAVAGGLAAGTKGTGLIAAPALVVLIGAAAWRYRPPRRLLAGGVALAVASLTVFGSFNYVLNARNTGDLYGGVRDQVKRASPVPENALRIGWSFFDTPGASLGWLQLASQRPAQEIFPHVEQSTPGKEFDFGTDSSVHEDTSAFGFVGFLLLFPLLLTAAFARRSAAPRRTLALCSLGYFAVFVVAIEFDVWSARLLMPMVVLGAPLLAWLYGRAWTRAIAVTLALASLIPCVIVNQRKPLLVAEEQKSVFQLDHIAQKSIARPEMDPVIRHVLRRVRPGDSLGFVGGEDSWDYPFFGRHRDRRVARLHPGDVTYERMDRERLTAVLFANVGRPPRSLRAVPVGPDYYFVANRPLDSPAVARNGSGEASKVPGSRRPR
jgi:hypothetical protein